VSRQVVSTTPLRFCASLTGFWPISANWSNVLNQLVGRITIRRHELPRWQVTPSAPTRPTTSSWSYDSAAHGVGKLASASITAGQGAGYQRSYSYDALTRLIQVSTTIAGTVYNMSGGYDANGRLNSVTYPSGPGRIGVRITVTASPQLPIAQRTMDQFFRNHDKGDLGFLHSGAPHRS
jgi:hypothetical protein